MSMGVSMSWDVGGWRVQTTDICWPHFSVNSQCLGLSGGGDFRQWQGWQRQLYGVGFVRFCSSDSFHVLHNGFGTRWPGGAAIQHAPVQLDHGGLGGHGGLYILRQWVFTVEQDQEAAVELTKRFVFVFVNGFNIIYVNASVGSYSVLSSILTYPITSSEVCWLAKWYAMKVYFLRCKWEFVSSPVQTRSVW